MADFHLKPELCSRLILDASLFPTAEIRGITRLIYSATSRTNEIADSEAEGRLIEDILPKRDIEATPK